MKTTFRLATLILALALPARAFAQFITFDPTVFAETVLQYELQSAIGNTGNGLLSSITGLNTQQLTTQNAINAAIGVVSGNQTPGSLTQSAISALSQGLGLDSNGSLGSIYLSAGPFSGSLDVFMGTTPSSFQASQGNPWSSFAQYAVNSSMNSIGASLGLGNDEITFASAVAQMDPTTRQNNSSAIANGLATLNSQNYANGAQQRRLTIQAEANLSQQAAARATNSTSANETAAAATELSASQARLAAIQAQQANVAAETLVIQGDATNHFLKEMNDTQARKAAEDLLAKKAAGNDN